MKQIIILGVLLSLVLVIPVNAQDDGSDYTCEEGENDILIATQDALDAEDWEFALELGLEGETLCASDVFRYRDISSLRATAKDQLELIEIQAYIDASEPGVVNLGDYSIFMRCVGEGTPTILFENELARGSNVLGWELEIVPELANLTQVCIYDRAGTGYSGFLPSGSVRTIQDMTDDLEKVLTIGNIEGPYILVGHHWGVYNMLLFADQYPDAIAGMVMLNGRHPDHYDYMSEFNPDSMPEPGEIVGERLDLWASMAQVQSVDDLDDIPLVVLTSGETIDVENRQQTPEFAMMWLAFQEEYATRSTNSQHIIVESAPHWLFQSDPDAVIDAVYWVWEQATGEIVEAE